jgi:hypothetical protein
LGKECVGELNFSVLETGEILQELGVDHLCDKFVAVNGMTLLLLVSLDCNECGSKIIFTDTCPAAGRRHFVIDSLLVLRLDFGEKFKMFVTEELYQTAPVVF